MKPLKLSPQILPQAVEHLAQVDPDLAAIHARLGLPPLWARPEGFPTLVHIILEQQVSLASARAAFNKLETTLTTITPQKFITLDDVELKAIGFSRQKMAYCRHLARAVLNGEIDLPALREMDDQAVRGALTRLKGIGEWTASIYLLMVLLRPDIWPTGDLALATAVQTVKRLPARPTADELERIAAPWQPWRAVAARLLWHDYLDRRGMPV